MSLVRGGCPHDCPDTCAWEVRVEDGRAIELRGVKEHPITRGGLCAKVNHYLDRVYSPDRLLHPLRRTGAKGAGTFDRVSWDDALARSRSGSGRSSQSRVARRCSRTPTWAPRVWCRPLRSTGASSPGSGRRGLFAPSAARRRPTGCSRHRGRATGWCRRTSSTARLIVLWGTNTIVTNLHLWPFVQEARSQGARVVVVDPLRTRTRSRRTGTSDRCREPTRRSRSA